VKAWGIRGFQNKEISNPIPVHSFGLTKHLLEDTKQVVSIESKMDMSSFGFTSAISCDCAYELTVKDPIDSIKITVKNIETNEMVEVTNNFTYNGYNSIDELLSENIGDDYNHFNLEIIKFDSIPNSSIFSIEIILVSGTKFTEQTQIINFE